MSTQTLDAGPAGTDLEIMVPMSLEAWAVRAGAPDARVLRIGIGPRRAALAAHRAAIGGGAAGAVVLAGFCGGLDDRLQPGDVVIASELIAPGGVIPCQDHTIAAGVLRRAGLRVHVGPIASSGRVIRGSHRVRMKRSGALAVDMESAQVARSFGAHRLLVLRVVLDTSEHELHRPVRLAKATVRAYRSLRTASTALAEWASALGTREVVLAAPRASCAGVERAVEVVERALERNGPPVYVRKQIVHNAHVISELEQRGAIFVDEVDEVPPGATLIFSAHGVSPEVRAWARERGLDVIDATCPLVAKVHAEARRFSERGYDIVLIGHEGHEEVEGTFGEAPAHTRIVADAAEAERVAVDDPSRVAYLTQTTLAVDDTAEVIDALRRRFPKLVGPRSDDICYATQNRQDAVRELASDCDLVLVIGSGNSSNSRRLVEVAQRAGAPAMLIEDGSEIQPRALAGVTRIGVTAGASAPEQLVQDVMRALAGLGPVAVSERRVRTEDLRFKLPVEVREKS